MSGEEPVESGPRPGTVPVRDFTASTDRVPTSNLASRAVGAVRELLPADEVTPVEEASSVDAPSRPSDPVQTSGEDAEVVSVSDPAEPDAPVAVGALDDELITVSPSGMLSLSGDGCPPGEPVVATIDGHVVGTATADEDDSFEVPIVSPSSIGQVDVEISCGDVVRTVQNSLVRITNAAGVGSSMLGTVMMFFLLVAAAAWPRRQV